MDLRFWFAIFVNQNLIFMKFNSEIEGYEIGEFLISKDTITYKFYVDYFRKKLPNGGHRVIYTINLRVYKDLKSLLLKRVINKFCGIKEFIDQTKTPEDLVFNTKTQLFESSKYAYALEINRRLYAYKKKYLEPFQKKISSLVDSGVEIDNKLTIELFDGVIENVETKVSIKSFFAWCEAYIDTFPQEKLNTRVSYRGVLHKFSEYVSEKTNKSDISLSLIDLNILEGYIIWNKMNGLLVSTVKKEIAIIRSLYNAMISFYKRKNIKLVEENPFELISENLLKKTKVEITKQRMRKKDYLTVVHIKEITNAVPVIKEKGLLQLDAEYTWKAYELMVSLNGIRVSDLLNLKMSSIDFDKGVVRIEPLKTEDSFTSINIRINENIEQLLRYFMQKRLFNGNDFFLLDRYNQATPYDSVVVIRTAINAGYTKFKKQLDALSKTLNKMGIDIPNNLTPHQARRTFANKFSADKLAEVSAALGHSNVDITKSFYYNEDEKIFDLND